MASKREQILAHIATTLAATSGINVVYRSRVEAFARDEAPALVVEPIADRCVPVTTCKLAWTLDVAIVVHTRGAVPDTLADPIIVSAHSLLMADRTLGGLAVDIVPTTMDPQRDKADLASLWQINTYQVSYRTHQSNLETG
jgi:hypothetical protein